MEHIFEKNLNRHFDCLNSLNEIKNDFYNLANNCVEAIKNGGKIIFAGNGGSASDSLHLAGELVGRFISSRRPLPSISLSADVSVITCIANDYGYKYIFSRQIEANMNENDIFVAISTSGNSENLIEAVKTVNKLKYNSAALLGKGGGKLKEIVEIPLIVKSDVTASIQEAHITIGHALCEYIELKILDIRN